MANQKYFKWFYDAIKKKNTHFQIILPIFFIVLIIVSFSFNILASNYNPPQKTISIGTGYNFNQYFGKENWIIATGSDGFEIWDVNSSSLITKYTSQNPVEIDYYRVVISPSDNLIIFMAEFRGGYINQLIFFRVSSKSIEKIDNFTSSIVDFAFSSTGKYFYYYNATGKLFEAFYSANFSNAVNFKGVYYLNFSPDDSYAVQTINQTLIRIYTTKDWNMIQSFNFSSINGTRFIWDPMMNFVIVEQLYYYYNSALIYIHMNWSVFNLPNFNLIKQDPSIITGDFAISPNSKYIILGTDGGFEIFNSSDWSILYQTFVAKYYSEIPGTQLEGGSLTFSDNGSIAIFNTHDDGLPSNYNNVIYLYNSLTNNMTKLSLFNDIYKKYNGTSSLVNTYVQLSPNGRYLFLDTSISHISNLNSFGNGYGYASDSPTQKWLLYDIESNRILSQATYVNQEEQTLIFQFSQDGKIGILRNTLTDSFNILNTETGKTIHEYSLGGPCCGAKLIIVNSSSILIENSNSVYYWTNIYQTNPIALVASFFNIWIELILIVILLVSLIPFFKGPFSNQ